MEPNSDTQNVRESQEARLPATRSIKSQVSRYSFPMDQVIINISD
jgi:hypothetical protein